MFALQCTLCWLHCMTIKCSCSWRPHNRKLYLAYTVVKATPTLVAWYWAKHVLCSGWLCTTSKPAFTKVRMRAILHVHFPAMGRCPHILLCAHASSSSSLTNLQKLPLLGASGSWCAIKSAWQMIVWLRSLKNQVHISSSTGHTEHHNKQMITTSHTKIIKLMFYSCLENRGLIVRFSTKVRMHATVPRVLSRHGAVPPHIAVRSDWLYLLTSAVLTYTLAVYCGLSFT